AEFLAWITPRWAARADLPAYAADLAAHELVEFAIGAAPASPSSREERSLAEVTLERALVFSEAARLMRYAHAVHELSAEIDDRTPPAARPTALLVYRDEEHVVRFLDLSPLAASIVEHLMAGEPLGDAVPAACADHGAPVTQAILNDAARILSDL